MSPFRLFFAGRFVSLLGSAMSPVALAFAVLDASGRATDLGVVLACQIVPQLALLLVGGVVADRFARRAVLLGSHLGAGVTQAAVATVIITGHYHLALVAALSAGNGAAEAFASPALRGIVPELVPADATQRANAALAAARNVCKIAGPTISGLLVVTVGAGWSIALDAASFFVAAVLLSRLRLGRPAGDSAGDRVDGGLVGDRVGDGLVGDRVGDGLVGDRVGDGLVGDRVDGGLVGDRVDGGLVGDRVDGGLVPVVRQSFRDLREGWAAFRGLPWVVAGAVSFGVLNLVNVGPWNILGPELTKARSGEAAWGVVLSVRAAGLLLMSVLLYRLTFRHPLRAGSLLGAAAGLPLLALGLGASLPVLLGAVFVGALGFTVTDITWDTAFQTNVPQAAMSRVASIDDLISYAAIPVGQLLTGPAAALLGGRRVALIAGTGYAVAKLAPLALRSVRDLTVPAVTKSPVTSSTTT